MLTKQTVDSSGNFSRLEPRWTYHDLVPYLRQCLFFDTSVAQVEIVAFLSGQLHGARWMPIRIFIVMEFVRKSGAPDGGSTSGAIGQRNEIHGQRLRDRCRLNYTETTVVLSST
jgi:hypothetical protein